MLNMLKDKWKFVIVDLRTFCNPTTKHISIKTFFGIEQFIVSDSFTFCHTSDNKIKKVFF